MENIAIKIEFERLKALAKKNKEDEKLHLKDFGESFFFDYFAAALHESTFKIVTLHTHLP